MESTLPETDKDCLWSWYDLSEARAVPCTSLRTFYLFLTAAGTVAVRSPCLSSEGGFADLTIYGPIADDANSPECEKEGRLRAEYRVHKEIIRDPHVGLSEEEFSLFMEIVRKKGKSMNMKLLTASINPTKAK